MELERRQSHHVKALIKLHLLVCSVLQSENFSHTTINEKSQIDEDEINYNVEWENFKAEVLPLFGIIADEYDLTKIPPHNRFIINDLPGSYIDREKLKMTISTFNNIYIYHIFLILIPILSCITFISTYFGINIEYNRIIQFLASIVFPIFMIWSLLHYLPYLDRLRTNLFPEWSLSLWQGEQQISVFRIIGLGMIGTIASSVALCYASLKALISGK